VTLITDDYLLGNLPQESTLHQIKSAPRCRKLAVSLKLCLSICGHSHAKYGEEDDRNYIYMYLGMDRLFLYRKDIVFSHSISITQMGFYSHSKNT